MAQAETWETLTDAPDVAVSDSGRSLIHNQGRFILVGSVAPNIMYSDNGGVNWTNASAPATGYRSVAANGDTVVAVGDNTGGHRVAVSTDNGATWALTTTGVGTIVWNGVTFGGGLFVAVGDSGGTSTVMTSVTGTTWTVRTALSGTWNEVTYADGLFVAVGSFGANRAMTSPDGITWTVRTIGASTWRSVTGEGGLFVAVGGGGAIATSPTGVTWTSRTKCGTASALSSVTFGDGVYVLVSEDGGDRINTSPDGVTWSCVTAPFVGNFRDVAYGSGRFISFAGSGCGASCAMFSGTFTEAPPGGVASGLVGPDQVEALATSLGTSTTSAGFFLGLLLVVIIIGGVWALFNDLRIVIFFLPLAVGLAFVFGFFELWVVVLFFVVFAVALGMKAKAFFEGGGGV